MRETEGKLDYILRNLVEQARANPGAGQHYELPGGLRIDTKVAEHTISLLISRLDRYPSQQEWQTVTGHWPGGALYLDAHPVQTARFYLRCSWEEPAILPADLAAQEHAVSTETAEPSPEPEITKKAGDLCWYVTDGTRGIMLHARSRNLARQRARVLWPEAPQPVYTSLRARRQPELDDMAITAQACAAAGYDLAENQAAIGCCDCRRCTGEDPKP
ncbi:MAG: hypothetical protein VB089_13595 [Anaerolineaceae bacterium]|nr:hypothetical protein [Anaerolineaceae bacterium]